MDTDTEWPFKSLHCTEREKLKQSYKEQVASGRCDCEPYNLHFFLLFHRQKHLTHLNPFLLGWVIKKESLPFSLFIKIVYTLQNWQQRGVQHKAPHQANSRLSVQTWDKLKIVSFFSLPQTQENNVSLNDFLSAVSFFCEVTRLN